MSGTEAISNGVPAFQKPESKNAATTLTIMATILGVFFFGVSQLATHMNLVPGEETIISQIARAVWGTNFAYYIFQFATMGILIVAGNTAFADFPRLSSVLARDNYMPHQFLFRGDRLAFSVGIVGLGTIASLLVIVFSGDVTNLIHLYAIGVFLAFSLSNSGMVVHWWRTRGPNWKSSIVINGMGAISTTIILVIVALTKFALGGWIVVVLVPIIVGIFRFIHRHYAHVAEQLRRQTHGIRRRVRPVGRATGDHRTRVGMRCAHPQSFRHLEPSRRSGLPRLRRASRFKDSAGRGDQDPEVSAEGMTAHVFEAKTYLARPDFLHIRTLGVWASAQYLPLVPVADRCPVCDAGAHAQQCALFSAV